MKEQIDVEAVKIHAKMIRKADGLTQRQLADRIGCKHGVVSLMERGVIRSRPAAKRLLEMKSEALDAI